MNLTIVEHLMDAQAANAAQQRALFNPSSEMDSALEHAMYLLKTADDGQRPHAVALVARLREVHHLNAQEREHERLAAGVADQVNGPITSVHEFVRLARPILADLGSKLFSDRKRSERRAQLRDLFARTHGRTLRSVSTRHLLGVKKYTLLVEELDRWAAMPEFGLGLPLTVESLGLGARA